MPSQVAAHRPVATCLRVSLPPPNQLSEQHWG